jgi:hypothetical protein
MVLAIVSATLIEIYVHNRVAAAPVETVTVEKVVEVDITSDRIEQTKRDIVTRLSTECEYQGWHATATPHIIDSDGKGGKQVVFGPFQFVPTTVTYYYKKLYGKEITQAEAIMCAMGWDCSYELAYDIIWEVKGGLFEWTNCANKLDLVKRVEVIKSL